MTMGMEVQLERMDSKLEKHIGITETILKVQQVTLEEIRDSIKEHGNKFVSRDEVELIEIAAQAQMATDVDNKLSGFEDRLDRKYFIGFGVATTIIGLVFGFMGILPAIGG